MSDFVSGMVVRGGRARYRWIGSLTASLLLLCLAVPPAAAQLGPEILDAIVTVRAEVPSEARTASALGRKREGTGVVIDGSGLVLTIGYLVLEASAVDIFDKDGRRIPAGVVAYDAESGFGLIRASVDIDAQPLALGDSAALKAGDPVLVLSNVGGLDGVPAEIADRRDFAGYWEYLLEEAIFTRPPHRQFGGAALVDTRGTLVGIGSLFVGDAEGADTPSPGNMFVPIDALKPIMGDLLAFGQRSGPTRPWLGIYGRDHEGGIAVVRVAEDGPAAAAGIRQGDLITGVGDDAVESLAQFYRKVWDLGEAGVDVPLQVRQGGLETRVEVHSADRRQWLRFDHSY